MSELDSDFGLDPAIARDLRAFFARRDGIERVWIFGSRSRGEQHARSDVDLAVDAPGLDASGFSALESALDELLFVRKVELVHWQRIADERFRREIEADRKLFWESPARRSEAA